MKLGSFKNTNKSGFVFFSFFSPLPYSSPLEHEASACLNCVCPVGYSAVPNLMGLLCGCVSHQVKRTKVEGGYAVS